MDEYPDPPWALVPSIDEEIADRYEDEELNAGALRYIELVARRYDDLYLKEHCKLLIMCMLRSYTIDPVTGFTSRRFQYPDKKAIRKAISKFRHSKTNRHLPMQYL